MSKLTASRMFAQSLGVEVTGPGECYYCSGPCLRTTVHGEPPPLLGSRRPPAVPAKCPSSPYMCPGCQRWKNKRSMTPYMGGGFETKPAREGSWWVAPAGSWRLRRESGPDLYKRLAAPPCEFALMLTDPGVENHIQLAVVNVNAVVKAETQLYLTLNNQIVEFSTYELYQTARGEVTGLEPGTQALVRFFGPFPKELVPKEEAPQQESRGRGRPSHRDKDPRIDAQKKVLRESGKETVT